MNFINSNLWLLLLVTWSDGSKDLDITQRAIAINKCCEEGEILNEHYECQHVNITNTQPWSPEFYDENGLPSLGFQRLNYQIVPGMPNCRAQQPRYVFEYHSSQDKLFLLDTGYLRHYTHYIPPQDGYGDSRHMADGHYFDHPPGTYCLDKALLSRDEDTQAAMVCVPTVDQIWDARFLMERILNPLLHVISIACLLTVSIVNFIIPPLRDLVGNILSTISVCLIVSQIADMICIFTEWSSHVSFFIADVIMYLSLLAAFFWLNSLGYYIWKTFRSRNVFLRVSDGRKYCYYSCYVWGVTIVMTLTALLMHFLFADSNLPIAHHNQETIGWLGIAVFFTPIACTILIDIYFYLTTARAISRMAVYGRIHGRMKFSFQLYMQLFLVMSTAWLFLLLSWLRYDTLVFIHIITNALQSILILVICVIGRKSVRAFLRKSFCQGENDIQWGEEMISMTSG